MNFFNNISTYRTAMVTAMICIAVSVSLGWMFDIVILKRPFPGLVAMNPVTALAFLLSGASFFLLLSHSYPKQLTGRILACVVLLIAALKILSLVTGWNIPVDTFLFRDGIAADMVGGLPNTMAPNTAFCFLMSGMGLVFIRHESPEGRMPAHTIAFIVGLISLLSILGYIYRVQAFYGVLSYIPMAPHTALCFLFLSLSILLAHPGKGLMKELSGHYAGSMMAKVMIPAAILLPSGLGLLRLMGQWGDLYSAEFGTAMFSITIITIFLLLIYYNAKMLNRRDQARVEAELKLADLNYALEQKVEERTREVLKNESIYKTIASSIPRSAILIFDRQENILFAEGEMLAILGYNKDKMIGHLAAEMIPSDRYSILSPPLKRAFAGEKLSMETQSGGKDMFVQIVPCLNEQEEVYMVMVISFDITEIKRANHQIFELNRNLEKKVEERTEQLQAVNKELESFSYSVSHDLRAPLRAIDGYARIIEEEYTKVLDDEGKRLLSIVQFNAKKMGSLIDDLLAFSRLGKKEMQKTKIDMKELLEGTLIEINKSTTHNTRIVLHELHTLKADYSLMSQVMTNLLSNAIKYSSKKENPVVEISSEERNDEIVYSVKDNGAGFDMKYSHKLFGVFQRLHTMDEFEGTGVGLAIVQRIISKHGGRVWAEARLGEGAVFYFSLPAN